MAQYDGSIRIGTGIDEKGFKAGSKELEAGARNLAKSVSDSLGEGAKIALQKQTDAFVKMNQQYAAQEQKVKDIAAKLHDVQRQKVETPIFKETSKELESAEKKLDNLYGTLRRLERERKTDTTSYQNAITQIDIYKEKISGLKRDLKDLKRSGEAYVPADTSKVQQELAAAEQKQMQIYTALQTSADAISQKTSERIAKEDVVREKIAAEVAEEERLDQISVSAVASNDDIIAKVERIKQLEQEIADLKSAGVTEGYEDYDSRIRELDQLKQEVKNYNSNIGQVKKSYSKLGAAAKKAFSVVQSAISKAGSGLKKFGGFVKNAFSFLNKSTKKSNGLLSTMASRFKGLALSLLIFNQISKAFNAMISGMKEGFGNLYKEVDGFKSAVDGLKASSLTLKNSFAAAFRPLVEIAIPYIQRVTDALASLMNIIGQFTAAITGQKTYTKAIKQTTAAIKDQNKAQNRQLSSLDKLNNLTSDKGGGSDSGGTEGMFEEAPISSRFADIAEWLKDMWKDSDFYGLGKLLGEKIKKALDSIPWEEIKEKAGNLGKSLATLINGFIEIDGLGYSIGHTLAEAFNTGFEFLNSFVHELHWDSLGKFIAETLNGIFENIDWDLIYDTFVTGAKGLGDAINSFADNLNWEAIATTVSNFVNTFVDTLYTFFDTVEWGDIGRKVGRFISDSLSEINWENFGTMIGTLFQSLFDFCLVSVNNIQWGEIGTYIANALNGIVSSIDLSSVGERLGMLLTDIFELAINFSSTFDWIGLGINIYRGINSFFASADFSAMGKGISDFVMGIFDTILVAIEGINWLDVGRSIVDFILGIDWIGLVSKLNDIGVQLIWGILKGILGVLDGIGKWMLENVFNPIIGWFKELFGIHSPSTVMEEMGKFLMEGLLGGIKSLVDTVVQAIKDVWAGIKEVFEGIIDFIVGIFTGDWERAWDGVTSIFEGIKTTIGGIVDGILGVINSVIEGISSAIQKVKEFFSESSKVGVSGAAGSAFGKSFKKSSTLYSNNQTSLPEPALAALRTAPIPKLATGAVIPANREFMAVLGDQKYGRNLEAPEDLIRKIVREESGGSGVKEITIRIPIEYDGNLIFEIVKKLDLEQWNRTGRPSFQM